MIVTNAQRFGRLILIKRMIKVKNEDGILLPIYWKYVGEWSFSYTVHRLSEDELNTAKEYFKLIGKEYIAQTI